MSWLPICHRPCSTETLFAIGLFAVLPLSARCYPSTTSFVAVGSPASIVGVVQQGDNSSLDPVKIFREGKEAMQSGDLSLAAKDFQAVIQLDPKSSPALTNLGVTFMRQKRWDDALLQLKKAVSLSPTEAGIWLNIGLVYYRKNDYPEAIAPFSTAIKLAPGSVQARYLLGLCYFFTNQYKDATDNLAPLWATESLNLNYLYVLSIAASKSANGPLQSKAFDQMLTIGKGTPEFHVYVGKAWLAQGDTTKALAEFKSAAATRPAMPLVHYFLGRTYLERRALPEAEAQLKQDAAIEPDFAYNYEDLGILYGLMNEPAKAEDCFRQAISRNKSLVDSYFDLAKLYRDQGRDAEALEMLDQAQRLAPRSASVHYTRGQVLKHAGKAAQANLEYKLAAGLFKSFNDRLQQDHSGDKDADAQDAAQQ